MWGKTAIASEHVAISAQEAGRTTSDSIRRQGHCAVMPRVGGMPAPKPAPKRPRPRGSMVGELDDLDSEELDGLSDEELWQWYQRQRQHRLQRQLQQERDGTSTGTNSGTNETATTPAPTPAPVTNETAPTPAPTPSPVTNANRPFGVVLECFRKSTAQ